MVVLHDDCEYLKHSPLTPLQDLLTKVPNVIGNATKFTEEGSITISTKVIKQHSKLYVVISVVDTGIGIDPQQQQKLFRPFVMVDGTTTRKFEGTGLGLAISRNLIELMGGKITLESLGLNRGTTVKIILPLIDISLLPAPYN